MKIIICNDYFWGWCCTGFVLRPLAEYCGNLGQPQAELPSKEDQIIHGLKAQVKLRPVHGPDCTGKRFMIFLGAAIHDKIVEHISEYGRLVE